MGYPIANINIGRFGVKGDFQWQMTVSEHKIIEMLGLEFSFGILEKPFPVRPIIVYILTPRYQFVF